MIELVHIAKRFVSTLGTVEALAELSLRIDDGEFVCLVGPSGCGKTTILNLVAGLELPDAGEVRIDGRPVAGPGPDRGVMFQDAGLFPWLTIRANVELALAMAGVDGDARRERANRFIDVVGIAPFADARPHELSGGMRQRGALARVLALEPRMLLMDEPFAALDVGTREEMHVELERLWLQTKMTIVFVTHDVFEAARLGSRVVVLGRRPAGARYDLRIDLPRPRDADAPEVHRVGLALRGMVRDAHESGGEPSVYAT